MEEAEVFGPGSQSDATDHDSEAQSQQTQSFSGGMLPDISIGSNAATGRRRKGKGRQRTSKRGTKGREQMYTVHKSMSQSGQPGLCINIINPATM